MSYLLIIHQPIQHLMSTYYELPHLTLYIFYLYNMYLLSIGRVLLSLFGNCVLWSIAQLCLTL